MISRRGFLQSGALSMIGAPFVRGSNGGAGRCGRRALVFDVFGTVVDWRTSVAMEVQALAKRKGLTVDGGEVRRRVAGGLRRRA